MGSIQWLEAWHFAQCDDIWEHQHGIKITTLDNPGWLVTIDLLGTSQEGKQMEPVGDDSQINHIGIEGNHSWLDCKVEGNRFIGAGGPGSLRTICEVFQKWVETSY